MTDVVALRAELARWLAAEPDTDMRDELVALQSAPDAKVEERFEGRMQFGTAGLRAGPSGHGRRGRGR